MSRWTIDEPTTLDFDGVVALRATLIAGDVSVLASDERPERPKQFLPPRALKIEG